MGYLVSEGGKVSLDALKYFVEKLSDEHGLSSEVRGTLIEQVDQMGVLYGKKIDKYEAIKIIAKQIDITRTGYVREPVDIQEFVESPEFMNQGLYVRPVIMEHLIRLFKDPERFFLVICGGGIGVGKNYFAEMAVSYMLYRMSCLYSPQAYYGLAPGSPIIYSFQSKTLALARRVVFKKFAGRLQSSNYFPKKFNFSPSYQAELKFPHTISVIPISGSETSALGMDIFTAIIDELNFMGRVRKSKHSLDQGEEEYDQAEKLYETVFTRLESRFMEKGRIPGKLFLLSSANYKGDFIDRRIDEAKKLLEEGKENYIFVMRLAQWESLPESKFSGKRFYVIVPTEKTRGAVLDDKPKSMEGVLEVPVEYKTWFEKDLDTSLRNIAGVPISKRGRLIDVDFVTKASDMYLKYFRSPDQLFRLSEVSFSKDALKGIVNERFLARIRTLGPFGAHIDLGYSEDSAGIAIGYAAGTKNVGLRARFDQDKGEFVEEPVGRLPVIVIVGALRINPPLYGEINLNDIRDLLLKLTQYIRITFVTMDWYQSIPIIQTFRASGVASSVFSLDRTPEAHLDTKNALIENRVLIPPGTPYPDEAHHLEIDRQTGRVDHEVGHSKDLADGVSAVVYNLSQKKRSYKLKEFKIDVGVPLIGLKVSDRDATQRAGVHRPSTGRRTLSRRGRRLLIPR